MESPRRFVQLFTPGQHLSYPPPTSGTFAFTFWDESEWNAKKAKDEEAIAEIADRRAAQRLSAEKRRALVEQLNAAPPEERAALMAELRELPANARAVTTRPTTRYGKVVEVGEDYVCIDEGETERVVPVHAIESLTRKR